MSKPASPRTLGSDLKRVDAHVIKPEEYEELPEMTDEMFSRVVFKKAGRPRSANPKQMISLRLPPEVVARWKATGPGWQTRMAKRLERRLCRVPRGKPKPSSSFEHQRPSWPYPLASGLLASSVSLCDEPADDPK